MGRLILARQQPSAPRESETGNWMQFVGGFVAKSESTDE